MWAFQSDLPEHFARDSNLVTYPNFHIRRPYEALVSQSAAASPSAEVQVTVRGMETGISHTCCAKQRQTMVMMALKVPFCTF